MPHSGAASIYCSRVGAIGAFAVNAMSVISYKDMLLGEGFEAALGQHVRWGFMLLLLAVVGPGKIAVDTWLERRLAGAAACTKS